MIFFCQCAGSARIEFNCSGKHGGLNLLFDHKRNKNLHQRAMQILERAKISVAVPFMGAVYWCRMLIAYIPVVRIDLGVTRWPLLGTPDPCLFVSNARAQTEV